MIAGFDGKTKTWARKMNDVPVCIPNTGCTFDHNFLVADCAKFDIILGKDFLVSIRAINDYAEGTLSFRSKENKRITLNCTATRDIPNEASNFISALHHIRLRGDGRATEIYHMLGNQEVKQAGQTESNPEEDFVCWTRKVDKDEEYTDKMLLLEPGDIYQQSEHFQEMVVHKNNEVFITHIEQIIEREMQEQPVSPDEQIKQFVGDKRTEHLKTATADKLIQLLNDIKKAGNIFCWRQCFRNECVRSFYLSAVLWFCFLTPGGS